jgi:hypothetical protein
LPMVFSLPTVTATPPLSEAAGGAVSASKPRPNRWDSVRHW